MPIDFVKFCDCPLPKGIKEAAERFPRSLKKKTIVLIEALVFTEENSPALARLGFEPRVLQRTIRFYKLFPDFEVASTLSTRLTGSHFVEIFPI